ncbi:hypothetical protein TNCV_2807551 [Trichonephila clavipes]|nr:hypothetical protein TNCV_2807551 [Trichonephila clavipes]
MTVRFSSVKFPKGKIDLYGDTTYLHFHNLGMELEGEGNILQSPALVVSAATTHKTFGPTDFTSTYSVCTRKVFGGIRHRAQAFQTTTVGARWHFWKGSKVDLQVIATEMGVEDVLGLKVVELREAILNSKYFDEFCREFLNTIIEERKRKKKRWNWLREKKKEDMELAERKEKKRWK